MTPIRVSRTVRMPDPVRLNRYLKSPELGPRVSFFSGGSALREASRVLKNYTHNSIHFVTPFDSGGSSAKLRKAFNMPSIGDLRSRLIDLADENITGHPDVYRLFNYRLSQNQSNAELLAQLDHLIQGKDRLIRSISNPMRRLIRNQLGYFREAWSGDFDLRGASIGNLILAGGYLNNHQHLDPIVFLFSKLVGVLGTVRTVINSDLHLGAELADGRIVLGQHRLTGKETAPLRSPIKRLFLNRDLEALSPATASVRKKNRKLIKRSDLICYPPGSFYSSLLANLLPEGIGATIRETDCPKVYVPNLGVDPEQLGMDLDTSVRTLLGYLGDGQERTHFDSALLNFILMDEDAGRYSSRVSDTLMRELGIQVIATHLVSRQSQPYYDPRLLVEALLSLT